MRGRGNNQRGGGSSSRGQKPPQHQAPSSRPSSVPPPPSGQQPSAVPQPSSWAREQMRDRLVFLLAGAAGSQVTVTLKNGTQFVGIFGSAVVESEMGVTLHCARKTAPAPKAGEEPEIKATLILQPRDVKSMETAPIDLYSSTSAPAAPVQSANLSLNNDSFRTDVQITGTSQADGQLRTLQQWSADDGASESNAGLTSSTSGNKAWNQFAANEKLFGLRSDYSEELYTTKLDRSGKDFSERERKAEALANEIMATGTSNPHVAEERGQKDESGQTGLSEEDKYSGVIRGNNAYIPPSARKAAAPTSAQPQSTSAAPATQPTQQQQQQPANAAPAMAVNGKPAAAPGPAPSKTVVSAFESFVKDEKKRLEPKKAAAVTKAREDKLAELRSFSQSFKLNYPMPKDLATLLDKKEGEKPASVSQTSNPASTGVSPVAREAKLAPRFASPAPPSTTAKPAASTGSAPSKGALDLPEIPSFAQLKQQREAKSAGAAKAEAWLKNNNAAPAAPVAPQGAPSTASRFSATAKEFKPNPNALSFTPGAASSPSRRPADLPGARRPAASPVLPAHPFFGSRPPKEKPTVSHVKEDFSPFKNAQVGDPVSVSHNWSFTGKSYRAILSTPSSPPQDDRARSPMSARSGNATPVHGLAPPPPSSMAFSPGPTQPMPLPGPGMQANMLQPGMPYPPMYYQQMPPQQYRYPGGPGGQPGMPPQMGMSPTPGMPYPQQQQQQFMGFPPGAVYPPAQPFVPNPPNMFSPRQSTSQPPPPFYYNPAASPQPGPPPPGNYHRKQSGGPSPNGRPPNGRPPAFAAGPPPGAGTGNGPPPQPPPAA